MIYVGHEDDESAGANDELQLMMSLSSREDHMPFNQNAAPELRGGRGPPLPRLGPRGTKVCRYSRHSAGSLGRPFPMLKYKYISEIKYTEAIFLSDSARKTVTDFLKLPNCRLQFKNNFFRVICYNFRHTFVPCAFYRSHVGMDDAPSHSLGGLAGWLAVWISLFPLFTCRLRVL